MQKPIDEQHKVLLAERADFSEVARMLAGALADDPVYAEFIGGGRSREPALRRFFRAYLRSAASHRLLVDLIRDRSGAIIAASIWERSELGRDSAVLTQVAHAVAFFGALGPKGVLRALRMQRLLEQHRPVEPHVYLMAIGVQRTRRGDGIGSSLLEHRLRQLDAAAEAAYLESTTPEDRRFFDRHGFVGGAIVQGLSSARPSAMFRPPGRRARRARPAA